MEMSYGRKLAETLRSNRVIKTEVSWITDSGLPHRVHPSSLGMEGHVAGTMRTLETNGRSLRIGGKLSI